MIHDSADDFQRKVARGRNCSAASSSRKPCTVLRCFRG